MSQRVIPTSEEVKMGINDLIVSKTDPQSNITYCNRKFIEISGYNEAELIGKPHSFIRHPDMPKAVYRLMWETIKKQEEFFGLVKNLCKNGAFYWTFANVTPSFDENHRLIGYFSVRRKPKDNLIKIIAPLYQKMCTEEAKYGNNKEQAMNASIKLLNEQCQQLGLSYNEALYTSI
jgi:PAS domain S-box-containing protein